MNEVENNNNQINLPIENKQEKKLSNKGKKILFVGIILLVLTLGIGGYFAYDKLFLNEKNSTTNKEYIFKTESEEEKNFIDGINKIYNLKIKEPQDDVNIEIKLKSTEIAPSIKPIKSGLDNYIYEIQQELKIEESYDEHGEFEDGDYQKYYENLINEYKHEGNNIIKRNDKDTYITVENVKEFRYLWYKGFIITNDGYIWRSYANEGYEYDDKYYKYEKTKRQYKDIVYVEQDDVPLLYMFVDELGNYYKINEYYIGKDLILSHEYFGISKNRDVYIYGKNKDLKYKFGIFLDDDGEEWPLLKFIISEDNYLYYYDHDNNDSLIKYPSKIKKMYRSEFKHYGDYITEFKFEFDNNKLLDIEIDDSDYFTII